MKRSQFALTIAKQKYEYLSELKSKLDRDKFIAFVEKHHDYLIWREETESGKIDLEEFRRDPSSLNPTQQILLNKNTALADFSKTRGYYTFEFNLLGDILVSTHFESNVKKKHLQLLLDLANELDALLLNRRKKIIDQAYIDTLPDD